MDSLSECVGSGEYQVRSSDFLKHAQKYCQETSQRRNRVVPDTLLPSPRTLKRLDTRLGLRNAHAEATTVARANACSSVRNAVSFAVMNKLVSTVVPPQLQLNVDGTQFRVGSKDNGRIVVKYRERVDGKALKVLPENGDGGLRYSIKYYALIAAFGFACDPIFVLADNSMDREALYVYEVKGLGIANSMPYKRYVVFAPADWEIGLFLGGLLLIYLFRTSFTLTIFVRASHMGAPQKLHNLVMQGRFLRALRLQTKELMMLTWCPIQP